MKKLIINLSFIFIAFPAVTFASGGWYGDDYSYDSNSWYGDDYSYGNNSWYGDNYSYNSSPWYGDDYGYDNGSWYGDDYSYGSNSWYGDNYSYNSSPWYGDNYSYDNSYYASNNNYNYNNYDYSNYDYSNYGYNDYDYGYNDYDYGYDNYDYDYNDQYAYNYDYGYNYDYNQDYYYDYGYDYNECTTCSCQNNCYNDDDDCRSNCTPPPTYDDLDLVCVVSDRNVEEGESVTFTAEADGGSGSYTYRWSGDVSGSSRIINTRFNYEGTYYGTVRVTDSRGKTATANCSSVVVEEEEDEDFDAVCKVSDSSIEEGDRVTFTADVDGGDSPFDYDWSGDADSSSRSFSKTFSRSGTYEVDLKVIDDEGRVARDTCTVRVKDEDEDNDNDRDINVVARTNPSNNDGNFASVDSVYLNQVPYTGPEDVAKGIAFAVGILAWSIGGALIIRNKMDKKAVSNRIEAFKSANKTNV